MNLFNEPVAMGRYHDHAITLYNTAITTNANIFRYITLYKINKHYETI